MTDVQFKKPWAPPTLKAHGTVEEITQQCHRVIDPKETNPFTLKNVPLVCRS